MLGYLSLERKNVCILWFIGEKCFFGVQNVFKVV